MTGISEGQAMPAVDKNNSSNGNNSSEDMASSASEEGKSTLTAGLKGSRKVPIVEVGLHNVFYRPQTSTASAGSSKKNGSGRTTVLSDISTTIRPYKLTAWMGPSGSGKTSLTSVVAGLVDPSTVTDGTITVNGEEGRLPKRYVGVVWQDDLLLSNLTVQETISFAARLKTPSSVSDADVQTLVDASMEELGLWHVRDHLIGSPLANMPGISGGERKRTAVAAELVVKPSLLILDEPTSGLDATTASSLMATLQGLAQAGHAVAVVIHQPRTDIFNRLDHLLLLSKGHVVYDGPARKARNYLESCPSVSSLPPETGIADWIMDTISADEKRRASGEDVLAKNWSQTRLTFGGDEDEGDNASHYQSTLAELAQAPAKYEASFWNQLRLLTGRTVKQRRGERLTAVSLLLTASYAIFTSVLWWQLPDDTSRIFERNSLLFFILIAQGNSIVVNSLTVFSRERTLLRRERAKKLYGVLPFFLAKTVSDMTNNILLPLTYGIITYFTAGLRLSPVHFFKFALSYYLTLSSAQSMGFFLSILIPNMQIALILAPSLTLFFFILGGFYFPVDEMNPAIKWASYISFARYGFAALVINEFDGRGIECSDSDELDTIGGGTGECPLPGRRVLEDLGMEGAFADYGFNVAIMAVMQVAFLLSAYVLLRRSR